VRGAAARATHWTRHAAAEQHLPTSPDLPPRVLLRPLWWEFHHYHSLWPVYKRPESAKGRQPKSSSSRRQSKPEDIKGGTKENRIDSCSNAPRPLLPCLTPTYKDKATRSASVSSAPAAAASCACAASKTPRCQPRPPQPPRRTRTAAPRLSLPPAPAAHGPGRHTQRA
jgi:hypothetical protein